MHMVVWTVTPMEGKSKDDLMYAVQHDAPQYGNVGGLVRMHYGIAADLKSVVEVYLWKSKADADRFFDTHWSTSASRRWEAAPMTRADFDVPVVVEPKN
jgi:hypothetical protein